MNSTDRERLLGSYPVLRELSVPLLRQLEAGAEQVDVPDGEAVFAGGDAATRFPLLVRGMARVARARPDGGEILLYRLAPGESCLLTAVSLLSGSALPATLTAEGSVRIVAIPRGPFVELVLTSGSFRTFVFHAASQRLGQLLAIVDDLAFRRVDQRLALLLLQRPRQIAATHQMLASEIGTSREVVSRILESFQADGMIRLGRKRIEILDPGALERLVGRTPGAAP